MAYHVEFTRSALRELKKPDRRTASLLIGWVRKNLEGCTDPRIQGKALTSNRSGQWRYRIGDCRILAEIRDSEVLILVISVGHRSSIYNK